MGMLGLILPLSWRNIWRNPRRTVITLIVVSVGVYSVLTMGSIIQAWATSTRDRALTLLNGSAQIHAPGFLEDPQVSRLMPAPRGALRAVLNGPDVTAWAPRLVIQAVIQSEYRSLPATFMAVDPAREKSVSTIPGSIAQGQYLGAPDDWGIVLGKSLARRLKTRLGKRVIILAQRVDGTLAEQGFVVTGLYSGDAEVEDRYAFAGLKTVQDMVSAGERVAEIALATADDPGLTRALAALKRAAPDLDTRSWRQLSPMSAAIEGTMQFFIGIFLWVMFVLMSFGIVNTQLMAAFERVREFGLMQALGLKPRMILGLVTLESAMLIGLGTLIGLGGALATISAMSGGIDISAFARGLAKFGSGQTLYPKIDAGQMLTLSLTIWVLGVVVALWPARKAASASPMEAMTHVS